MYRLYRPNAVYISYIDTDSFFIRCASSRLEECEKKDLSDEDRKKLREALYGGDSPDRMAGGLRSCAS